MALRRGGEQKRQEETGVESSNSAAAYNRRLERDGVFEPLRTWRRGRCGSVCGAVLAPFRSQPVDVSFADVLEDETSNRIVGEIVQCSYDSTVVQCTYDSDSMYTKGRPVLKTACLRENLK